VHGKQTRTQIRTRLADILNHWLPSSGVTFTDAAVVWVLCEDLLHQGFIIQVVVRSRIPLANLRRTILRDLVEDVTLCFLIFRPWSLGMLTLVVADLLM